MLAEAGLTATPKECHQRVAYDDPCHLCHGQGVRSQPRDLLRQVPDVVLQESTQTSPVLLDGHAGIPSPAA